MGAIKLFDLGSAPHLLLTSLHIKFRFKELQKMKMTKNKLAWKRWSTLLGAAAIVSIVGVAGCADRNDNGQPDSAATPGEINNATDTAGQATENAADATANAAGNAAESTADVATQSAITGKIKTALLADTSVGATKIDVDTVEDTKTVTLSGEVTNAAQKTLAEKIAKKQAPDYKIDNKLTVKGGASPVMDKKKG
jgi:osmotically-inducible protein OsmY